MLHRIKTQTHNNIIYTQYNNKIHEQPFIPHGIDTVRNKNPIDVMLQNEQTSNTIIMGFIFRVHYIIFFLTKLVG